MNLSVVIPVYNGQHTIGELVERLGQVLPGICDSYETLLVCDGSPDGSWQVIEQLASRDRRPCLNHDVMQAAVIQQPF